MSDRCGAETASGAPCRAYPVVGSDRCVVHQEDEPHPGEGEDVPDDRCGHPTKRGGLCRQYPMQGSERCYVHQGLEPTEAERQASRTNRTTHGYFVQGFLDDDEEALFERVLEGQADPGELKQHVVGALVVRANRMMRWEAEGQQVSGFATEVFGELRKALESISTEELRVEHSWDDVEVAQQVRRVLDEDPELLVRLLPPVVQDTVREALEEAV